MRFSFPGLAWLPLLWMPLQAAEVYIGLKGSGAQWMAAIGMPPFAPERSGRTQDIDLGRQVRDVVRSDLMYSRYFKILDTPPAIPLAESDARHDDWKKAGAGFILTAKAADLSPKGSVAVALIDLASGRPILERTYRQDIRFWRSLGHQIANDVTRQLTGHSGVSNSQIAFVNDQTGNKEVYVVDYDGADLRRLTNDRSIDLLPRWKPDRSKILYTSFKLGNPDLFEFDMARGTSRAFLDYQGLNIAGGFSPDGARLVLTLSRQKNPNIFLLDLSNGSLSAVTSHFGIDSSPTFAPDGRQVAFVSDRSGNPEVHIQELSNGKVRRLTRFNWCDSPSWSPTGEWIVFAGRANPKDRMDIFLVDVTGTHVRQVTHGEGSNEDPSWSPDGRFIAFTTTRNVRRELYAMDADGSAPHAVGNMAGNSFTPNWGP